MTLRKQLNVLPQNSEVQIVCGTKEEYIGVVSDARKRCQEGLLDSSAYVAKSIPLVEGRLKIVIKSKEVAIHS